MWVSLPRRARIALCSTGSSGSFWVFSCRARLVRLSTMTSPSRSRMSPRGAITLNSWVRLFFASARYLSPSRTCRFQSRKKRAAKRMTAAPPSTATRRARRLPWGLSSLRRYMMPLGSHHSRPAAAPHRRLVDQRRPQHPPEEGVDRPAEEEGEDALQQHVAQHQRADRGVDPQRQLDRAEAELGEEGQPHAEERRHQRAVDLEALAEAAGGGAGREQHQRAAAERRDQQAVEQEPDREAADRPRQGAAEEAQDHDQRRQHIGADVEGRNLGEEGELEDDADDDDRDQADEDVWGEDHRRDPPVKTWTRSRSRRSAKGLT